MNYELSRWFDARVRTMNAVIQEIERHDELKKQGRFDATCFELADAPYVNAAILTEEVGEVARAVQQQAPARLFTELIQVASVALAWAEALQLVDTIKEKTT